MARVRTDRDTRPVVLVLLGAFWPGHDATGPNQSFRGLARALGDEFEFKLVARDRPFGASVATAPVGEWVDRGYAQFRYCRVETRRGPIGLRDILRQTPHDILMMNGFFDREFTIPALMMRRLGRIPRRPTLLSTRGEFAGGALGLKGARKQAFLQLGKVLRLHRDIWLHATTADEARDIEAGYGHMRGVLVAPNVRQLEPLRERNSSDLGKTSAPLRLAFLGRIARVKNLDVALRALRHVKSPVVYNIYGPVQEPDYWSECRAIIAGLPAHVTVSHKGEISNDDVPAAMADTDLFFLPTKGENFGHAILDALAMGTPVVISDTTPFRELKQQGAGWDLVLDDEAGFAAAIDDYAGMDAGQRAQMRRAARRLAEQTIEENGAISSNRQMLRQMLMDKTAR